MSNITEENIIKKQEQQQLFIDFLGAPEFVTYLEKSNLSPMEHNKLFGFHLLAIGFNSTGISAGGLILDYAFIIENWGTGQETLVPASNFFFYTTKNTIIEDSLRSSRISLKVHNKKHVFKLPSQREYSCPRTFKDFLVGYSKLHMKTMTNEEHALYASSIKPYDTIGYRVEGVRDQTLRNEEFYKEIIDSEVFSFISFHLMNEQMKNTNTMNKKMKI